MASSELWIDWEEARALDVEARLSMLCHWVMVADRFGQTMPMGWGWGLRMSAPSRVLKEIERANQAGRPAVLTIHPWEIDPDPPRVALPPGLRFAHYFRLNGFRGRLRAIVRGASFAPLPSS